MSPNVALTFLPVPVPSFTKKHMNTPEPSSSPCPDQPDSTVQPSNDSTSAPPLINSQTPELSAFTAPMTLKEIGYDRVFRFFRPFALDLQSAGISWPEFHPGNDDFYVNLAQLLNLPSFPQSAGNTLGRIERLAAPENRRLLDDIFVQQLSNVTIPTTSPALHRALELWFLSPQLVIDLTESLVEPSSLAAPKSDESGPAAPNSVEQPVVPSSPIENRKSKIENGSYPCPSGPIRGQKLCSRFLL